MYLRLHEHMGQEVKGFFRGIASPLRGNQTLPGLPRWVNYNATHIELHIVFLCVNYKIFGAQYLRTKW